MLDPCCGSSLRRGAKLIAFVDMGLSVIQSMLSVLFIALILTNYDEVRLAFEEDREDFPQLAELFGLTMGSLVAIFVLTTLYFIAMFLLAKYLYQGADERDYKKLNRWYNISLILVVLRLIFYLSGLLFSAAFGAFGIFGIIYQIYCLWIVRALLRKISYSAYWDLVGETTWLNPVKSSPSSKIIIVDNQH